jgi:uncharacterized membrane protein YhhN
MGVLSPSDWAYGLLVVGLGVYVVSFVLGASGEDRTHRSATWARMANSLALVLAAFVWWQGPARGTPLAAAGRLIFCGMASSFVGDLLMARVIRLPRHPIPGMVAFGGAHGCYIAAFVRTGRALGLVEGTLWALVVVGMMALSGVVWRALIDSPRASRVLRYGSLGYAALLASMTGSALALAVQEPRFSVLAGGAFLFLVSDTILGNRLLRRNDWFLVGDVVWAIYVIGQALIVFTMPIILPLAVP